ncbi:MAG: hypothetical protein WBE00_06035, partial [Phycisphaerae bacterium]
IGRRRCGRFLGGCRQGRTAQGCGTAEADQESPPTDPARPLRATAAALRGPGIRVCIMILGSC